MDRYSYHYDNVRRRPPPENTNYASDYGYGGGYRRGWDAAPTYDERSDPAGRLRNRVTQRYNRDYVVGYREDPRSRNFNMYTGDRPQRMGDPRYYRRPYMTVGGTRTYRGSSIPTGYDRPYEM